MASRLLELKKKWLQKGEAPEQSNSSQGVVLAGTPFKSAQQHVMTTPTGSAGTNPFVSVPPIQQRLFVPSDRSSFGDTADKTVPSSKRARNQQQQQQHQQQQQQHQPQQQQHAVNPIVTQTLKAGIPLGKGRTSIKLAASPMNPVVFEKTEDEPMNDQLTLSQWIKEHQVWLRNACGPDYVVFSTRTSYKFNKKDYREAIEFIEGLQQSQPHLFA